LLPLSATITLQDPRSVRSNNLKLRACEAQQTHTHAHTHDDAVFIVEWSTLTPPRWGRTTKVGEAGPAPGGGGQMRYVITSLHAKHENSANKWTCAQSAVLAAA
jgi:hypothetical protein